MKLDYRDAAERHWGDAKFLHAKHRHPNADHLAGLSAECSLKAIMLGLGMAMRGGIPQARHHAVHIDLLWEEFVSFAGDRRGSHYARRLGDNPFTRWRVEQRYSPRQAISDAEAKAHLAAADSAILALQDALLDGILDHG